MKASINGVKMANGPTILTAGGHYFDLLDPEGSVIEIDDIAAALSKICRFTGHCSQFYSVAEHSVLAARLAPPEIRAAVLLHDAAEAYVGDVSRPLKMLLPEYKRIEKAIEAALLKRFEEHLGGVRFDDPRIKAIDAAMLRAERMQLMPATEDEWNYGAVAEYVDVRVNGWLPELAALKFREEWLWLS